VSNKAIRERETELWHMREALKSYEAQLAQAVKERDAERHAGEALVRQVQARNKHIAEVRALHSECIIERDTAIRQRDALAEHLRTITADNLVPRAELDAAVAERDVAVAEALVDERKSRPALSADEVIALSWLMGFAKALRPNMIGQSTIATDLMSQALSALDRLTSEGGAR
jgi:hypothetical protein